MKEKTKIIKCGRQLVSSLESANSVADIKQVWGEYERFSDMITNVYGEDSDIDVDIMLAIEYKNDALCGENPVDYRQYLQSFAARLDRMHEELI